MRMLAAYIDVQVAVEGCSQSVLRKHAADGVFQNAFGMAVQQLGRGGLTLATGITGLALINLVGHFLTRENDFLCINDDNIVAAINVRSEARFGLASQDVGNAGCQTSNGLVFCIDKNPFFLYGVLVGRYGFVA